MLFKAGGVVIMPHRVELFNSLFRLIYIYIYIYIHCV